MMKQGTRLEGIIAPVLVPFDSNGKINTTILKEEVDFAINTCKVHGIMTVGTESSEFGHLSTEEKMLVTETVAKANNARVPLVAGASGTHTGECIELAKHAKRVGATAVVITPPYVVTAVEEEIIDLYKAVSDTVDIPIMCYNSTILSYDLKVSTLSKIASVKNVVSLKESSRHFGKIGMECVELLDRITLLTTIHVLVPTLLFGGHGCIVPVGPAKLGVQIYNMVKSGDLEGAIDLQKRSFQISEHHVEDRRLATPFYKQALTNMGINVGLPRGPFHDLPAEEKQRLAKGMREVGLIS